MKKIILFSFLAAMGLFITNCTTPKISFSDKQLEIIGSPQDSLMRVLQITNIEDSEVLHTISTELTHQDILSEYFQTLIDRMLLTVKDPSHPGVGIAAPQVGINKRLIAVQRFDKKGKPFEFYTNVYIEKYSDEKKFGREGCLSVPDRAENVCRSTSITISYIDIVTMKRVSETIEGFTAVIFQHEIDHLDGIIYIERELQKNN